MRINRSWSGGLAAAAVLCLLTGTPASAQPNPTPNHVAVTGGVIVYSAGWSRTNVVVVTDLPGLQVKFTDTGGIKADPGCVQGATSKEAICTAAGGSIYNVEIGLGNLNDTATLVGAFTSAHIVIDAGVGNDTVDLGTSASQPSITVRGGSGADTLTTAAGSTGQHYLDGGDGADVICGGVNTAAFYGDRLTYVRVTPNDIADDGSTGEGDNVCATIGVIVGGHGNDVLFAGPAGTVLRGTDGHDALYGGPGPDKLYGDFGQDVLSGGAGDDILQASLQVESYAETVNGGTGTDACRGDSGDTFTACESIQLNV